MVPIIRGMPNAFWANYRVEWELSVVQESAQWIA